jgi:hypothetical protein
MSCEINIDLEYDKVDIMTVLDAFLTDAYSNCDIILRNASNALMAATLLLLNPRSLEFRLVPQSMLVMQGNR